MDELDPALAATIAAIPEWDGLEPEVTPITIRITNRNFRVDIGGESFVVRLSGKDTDLWASIARRRTKPRPPPPEPAWRPRSSRICRASA